MSELHRIDVAAGSLAEMTLGLAAVIRRFDALLAAYAPPHPAVADTEAAPDRTLDLVLGLVALRERIAAELARCESSAEASEQVPAPESWLR